MLRNLLAAAALTLAALSPAALSAQEADIAPL